MCEALWTVPKTFTYSISFGASHNPDRSSIILFSDSTAMMELESLMAKYSRSREVRQFDQGFTTNKCRDGN